MASNLPYPATVQEMFDRLVADRAFRIRLTVADNYPAVRERFLDILQSGYPEKVNTPEKLIDELLWWDANDPAGVDQVLDVPYRNSTGSGILSEALEQGREVVQTEGDPKLFGPGFAAGISGIFTAVGEIANGRHSTESNERVANAAITAQLELERAKGERNAKLARLGIIAGAIVVVVLAIILLRK